MKEFNLEKAKNGAAVCMRDGTPVKILDFEFAHPNGKAIFYKYKVGDLEDFAFADMSGKVLMITKKEEQCKYDLFMTPTVGYMCIYNHNGEILIGGELKTTLSECRSERESISAFSINHFYCYAKVELLENPELPIL